MATSLKIHNIEIPTSQHPEVRKLKRKNNVHTMHGNKVWNSSIVFMDAFKDVDFSKYKIADLGCGWGPLSCYFAKQGAEVTGFDNDISVKPYFDLLCKITETKPKFQQHDIFQDDLPLDYDFYVACDMCFWNKHIDLWHDVIYRILDNNKSLFIVDPGRQSFWKMLNTIKTTYHLERRFIEEPKKTDAYIAIFGN